MISLSENPEFLLKEVTPKIPTKIMIFPSFCTELIYFPIYEEKVLKSLSFSAFISYYIVNEEYIVLSSEEHCVLIKISNINEISQIFSSIEQNKFIASTEDDMKYISNASLIPESEESFLILISFFIALLPTNESELFSISHILELAAPSLITYFLYRYHCASNLFKDPYFFHFQSNEFKLYNADNLITLKAIREGKNAEVNLVFDTLSGNIFVLKTYNDKENFLREKQLYEQLKNQSLVNCVGYDDSNGLLMEFMCNGSLQSKINDKMLDQTMKSKIIYQLLAAIDYLHSKGIVHYNVTMSNVLLDNDMNAHLTGFENAIDYSKQEIEHFPYEYDIFSLGILVYELSTGINPFPGLSLSDSINEIKSGRKLRLNDDDFYHIRELCCYLTENNSSKRYPTFFLLYKTRLFYPNANNDELYKFLEKLYANQNTLNEDRFDYKIIIRNSSSGKSDAQCKLAFLYKNGIFGEVEYDKAKDLYYKAAHSGDPYAQYALGEILYNENPQESFHWCFELANQGFADAQNKIGCFYKRGIFVDKDIDMAFSWFYKAANQGQPDSQYRLGKCSRKNNSLAKRIIWNLKSSNQGNLKAKYFISLAFLNGWLVNKNIPKGLELLKKAAERGDNRSQFTLGNLYYSDLFVEEDYKKALYWFEKAADQGNSEAEFSIAQICGLTQKGFFNPSKSIEYYIRAENHGHEKAKFILAMKYYFGNNVEKNIPEAIRLLHEATSFGSIKAMFFLAQVYEAGKYVKKDLDLALTYYIGVYEKKPKDGITIALATFYLYRGDELNGMKLIQEAVSKNNVMAMFYLAHLYLKNGFDIEYAVSLLKKAANKSYTPAQYELAMMYKIGQHVPKKLDKYQKLIIETAKKGVCNACYEYGMILEENGSIDEAIRMYEKACRRPNDDVLIRLITLSPDKQIESHSCCTEIPVAFGCITCELFGHQTICSHCAFNCHKGHDIIDYGELSGYECDCGMRGPCCQAPS